MTITAMTGETLPEYRDLILPHVYEELSSFQEDLDTKYICLAVSQGERPAAALIAQMEETGDIGILSVYTLPEHRRKGLASALMEKTVQIARALFQWEEGETVEYVAIKSIYRLPEDLEKVYRAFLEANHFTEFVLLRGAEEDPGEDGDALDVWCGFAEARFWKTAAEGESPGAPDDF